MVIARQTLSRELRVLSYRKPSARPRHHAQADGAIEEYKKVPRVPGGNRARKGGRSRRYRNLVRRRSARRPEKQDHAKMGKTRHEAIRAAGSAHGLDLHLRRYLSEGRQGRRPRFASLQHRSDEPASRQNRDRSCPGCHRSVAGRSGWMAHVEAPHRAARHRHRAAAPEVPGIERAGKHLAVHAGKLALQPRLQIVQRYPRPLLSRMEQPRRPTMAHHVNRIARLGAPVLIRESSYESLSMPAPRLKEHVIRSLG